VDRKTTTSNHSGVGFDYNGAIVDILGHFQVRFRVRVSSVSVRVRVSVRIRYFAACLLPYLTLPHSLRISLLPSLKLTALGVLCMLPVLQRIGDAYGF